MAEIKREHQLIEQKKHWIIPLRGETVTRCFVDNAFGIEFQDCEMTIRIEGTFYLNGTDKEYKLSPEHPTTLGPALALFQKKVRSSVAHKEGWLELEFSDGSRLSVEADADYEAWEIVGSGGLRIVCAPGGRLSVWQQRSCRTV
jgi:hypothetical protein